MTIKLCFWRSFCNATHKENCGRLSHFQVLENVKSQELPGALPWTCWRAYSTPKNPQLVWVMTYGHCWRPCGTQHLKINLIPDSKKMSGRLYFPYFDHCCCDLLLNGREKVRNICIYIHVYHNNSKNMHRLCLNIYI